MAGMGPAPKAPDRRARHGGKNDEMTVIEFEPAAQPDLPDAWPWPDETVQWWRMWADSPLSRQFGTTDWAFLMDTAILHARLWMDGDVTVMAELRLRVAKFGATPEDRARLRIQFAEADEADTRRGAQRPTARERRANVVRLRSVPDAPEKV